MEKAKELMAELEKHETLLATAREKFKAADKVRGEASAELLAIEGARDVVKTQLKRELGF